MASTDDNTVMTENPAYNITPGLQHTNRSNKRPHSIIVFTREPLGSDNADNPYPEFEKTGSSSKWDHHITLAVILTIVSALCLNVFALGCGIAGIYFAIVARIASRNDDYYRKLENERVSFGFVIVCIMTLIVTVCIIGFSVHEGLCGKTGVKCRF